MFSRDANFGLVDPSRLHFTGEVGDFGTDPTFVLSQLCARSLFLDWPNFCLTMNIRSLDVECSDGLRSGLVHLLLFIMCPDHRPSC